MIKWMSNEVARFLSLGTFVVITALAIAILALGARLAIDIISWAVRP